MLARCHQLQVLGCSQHVPPRSGEGRAAVPGATPGPAHRQQHASTEREDHVGEAAAESPGGAHPQAPGEAQGAQDLAGEGSREEVQQDSPCADRV